MFHDFDEALLARLQDLLSVPEDLIILSLFIRILQCFHEPVEVALSASNLTSELVVCPEDGE